MAIRLIVNADDFGLTRGVNAGIVEAHRHGILTATTLMANGPAFDHAVELARATPSLDVGVHLVLWEEAAIPQRLPSFLLRAMRMPTPEIARLFSAQIERVKRAGIAPTHLDTHKHTHVLPRVMRAVEIAAREHGISWIRRPLLLPAARGFRSTDYFAGYRLTGRMNRATLAAELQRLRPGLTELMCHPGHYDADLESSPTRLKGQRAAELDALTAPEIRAILESKGIQLVSYREATLLGRGADS